MPDEGIRGGSAGSWLGERRRGREGRRESVTTATRVLTLNKHHNTTGCTTGLYHKPPKRYGPCVPEGLHPLKIG